MTTTLSRSCNNHATRLIIDHTVANNHIIPVANNDATMIVIHDRAVTDNHFRARDNNRIGSHYDWLHRVSDLVEQGLAMAETVEVQAHQAAPVAFEDEELLLIVIAPDLAAIDLVTLAVDNAELVAMVTSTLGSLICISMCRYFCGPASAAAAGPGRDWSSRIAFI